MAHQKGRKEEGQYLGHCTRRFGLLHLAMDVDSRWMVGGIADASWSECRWSRGVVSEVHTPGEKDEGEWSRGEAGADLTLTATELSTALAPANF
jgi:hypothetical protein